MKLDEAIKHAEEVAEEKEKLANTYESFKDYGNPKSSITLGHEKCLKCAEEHRQLAEWLKELKQLREQMQESEAIQFARWVANEIFSDMWELNKDAFDELACRKLAKLGIVRANGDEWELVEPQESKGEHD